MIYGNFNPVYSKGRRVIGNSGSPIRSKPLMELIVTLVANFGEVRRAQLAKSTLTSTLVPLGSFKFCSDAKEKEGCGKQWKATAPIQSLVKLKSCLLSLQWKTCLRQNCSLGSCAGSEGQNTHDDEVYDFPH